MKCMFCRSDERIEFEFPKGVIFGERCNNDFCAGGVKIYVFDNPHLQAPFPDKRERKRFQKERENYMDKK